MKHFVAIFIFLSVSMASAGRGTSFTSAGTWQGDKYSMFIHFGLYSFYGGVWDGKPVDRGYSEQIQSHAGIFSDWYASAAAEFDPERFDAEEIVALAKEAGMRSVVFTSKHHDGFCMFDTETTGYNSVDMTPSGRDFVRELSSACRDSGLKFGLYFSLIDWNYPHAYPISSHNADFITDEHHEFNKRQVAELLTAYGDISELWFDMGSLTPEQSRELYELVHHLQPGCMVSGRLGNDMYDFAVMPDNFYPDSALQAPWQCAASMFDETWGWRSWQERGSVEAKAAEKLRSLINVVAHGGNYLLNIGPDAEGNVVSFEREVLGHIGKWLSREGSAIYGTVQFPGAADYDWGTVTLKGDVLNLILSGSFPSGGTAFLPLEGSRMIKVLTPGVTIKQFRNGLSVRLTEEMYADPLDIKVLRVRVDGLIKNSDTAVDNSSGGYMTASDAVKDYSYSCFDYYSNYRSTVAYRWHTDDAEARNIDVIYPSDGRERRIVLDVNEDSKVISTASGEAVELPAAEAEMGTVHYDRIRGGSFNGPAVWKVFADEDISSMRRLGSDEFISDVTPFSNHVIVSEVDVMKSGFLMFEICAGNGLELVIDGKSIMKHLNPYRTVRRTEYVPVYLDRGVHQVVLRAYNRFESELHMCLRLSDTPLMRVRIPLADFRRAKAYDLRISNPDLPSVHTDCGLHDIVLKLNR